MGNANLAMKKESDKTKLKDSLQNTQPVLLKTVKVVKYKESYPGQCAQWLKSQSMHRRVVGSIPSQEHVPQLWVHSQPPVRPHGRGNW